MTTEVGEVALFATLSVPPEVGVARTTEQFGRAEPFEVLSKNEKSELPTPPAQEARRRDPKIE
jgi:hypothetical protein